MHEQKHLLYRIHTNVKGTSCTGKIISSKKLWQIDTHNMLGGENSGNLSLYTYIHIYIIISKVGRYHTSGNFQGK